MLIVSIPQEHKQELNRPVQVKAEAVVTVPKIQSSISDEKIPQIVDSPKEIAQPASSGNSIEEIVRQAARNHGIDENYFVHIAKCESSLNPNSVNYGYNENGYPSGLFQHLSGYWPSRAAKYGYAGASVFDATANANVTAAMFAEGHSNLWECK